MEQDERIRNLLPPLHKAQKQLIAIEKIIVEERDFTKASILLLAILGALRSLSYQHFLPLFRANILWRINGLLGKTQLPDLSRQYLENTSDLLNNMKEKEVQQVFIQLRKIEENPLRWKIQLLKTFEFGLLTHTPLPGFTLPHKFLKPKKNHDKHYP